MAEEEVLAVVATPAPSDHKRKLEDMEAEAPEPLTADQEANSNSESESANEAEDGEETVAVADGSGDAESQSKRSRLEDKPDGLATENGHQGEEKVREPEGEKDAEQLALVETNAESEVAQDPAKEVVKTMNNEPLATDDHHAGDVQRSSDENPQLEKVEEQQSSQKEVQEPSLDAPSQGDAASVGQEQQHQPSAHTEMSRHMEVPNNKVGVLIGKGGDTIKYLQYNSGAKIQITKDAVADPFSATRPVELIGTLENINKAEKLIRDVIAESASLQADAGGSPSLVARGFDNVQAAGAGEQIRISVPNEKVGLIIGKSGETIKNLQTKSGARVQLMPQHLCEGDQSKERIVRVTGDKRQIELARELIKEVMNQPVRRPPLSGGYNRQAFHQRGPAATQWGSRGPHPAQPMGYEYQQRGPYPSQNPQYQPQAYGNYPQQQQAPRSSFGPGWEQKPPATMQGPSQQAGGYDYYGGQVGHIAHASASGPLSNPVHTHAPGPLPAPAMGPHNSHTNYNYGHPQGPDYGQPTPYSQGAPYGHGGSHYLQGGMHSGYGSQEQYGRVQSYSMPPQGSHLQSYGHPRPNQPADMPYQGSILATQSYGSNVPSQHPYPYSSGGPMQQTYPSYGPAPASDGYSHPLHVSASTASYPPLAGQPVSGYNQPSGQQAPGYGQMGQAGGYGAYPSPQPGYIEQPAPNNAGYGYQGSTDPAYGGGPGTGYGVPTVGQAGYTQPTPTPPGYDQLNPQLGGIGAAPAAGYGKSSSPQPGYPQY